MLFILCCACCAVVLLRARRLVSSQGWTGLSLAGLVQDWRCRLAELAVPDSRAGAPRPPCPRRKPAPVKAPEYDALSGAHASQAQQQVAAGPLPGQVREIWLSSEDTGAYGRDIGTSLPALLRSMLALLPQDGSTMLRVGMTNPVGCGFV